MRRPRWHSGPDRDCCPHCESAADAYARDLREYRPQRMVGIVVLLLGLMALVVLGFFAGDVIGAIR